VPFFVIFFYVKNINAYVFINIYNQSPTVKTILSSLKIEQQAFRSCMGLLRLADKYSSKRLEAACAKALSYTPYPSLKSVKTILASGVDSVPTEPTKKTSDEFGFTHGSDYYGRKH